MIDLEFEASGEAERFLRTMQRIWDGPGRAVMHGPRGRIVDVVVAKDV
jgi:hypothetical protein